jgi:hypothetical protein
MTIVESVGWVPTTTDLTEMFSRTLAGVMRAGRIGAASCLGRRLPQ